MPIHDWTRVPAGLFHDFHQTWSIHIKMALNQGRLPYGFSALVEQRANPLHGSEKSLYADRANRIVVRHHLGRIVAAIELVSPGNKMSQTALRDFVDKCIGLLRQGIHLLVVDLFPPSPCDPFGIHKAVWDEITEQSFALPTGQDRILVSYEAGTETSAFVETVAVRASLPDMPLFLLPGQYIQVPLEPTYQHGWDACPGVMRNAVETGILPEPDA
jgi:hypothetical protein